MAEISVTVKNVDGSNKYTQKFEVSETFAVSDQDPLLSAMIRETKQKLQDTVDEVAVRILFFGDV